MKMYLIYSADENWAIGKNNDLLVRIPEDMRDRFKALTIEKTVVMGKNTLLSLPKQKGLPRRKNIVLTRNTEFECDNAQILHSLDELFAELENSTDDIFVIGGGEVYTQLMPYCHGAYVTRIFAKYEDATVFVPNLDESCGWEAVKASQVMHSEADVDFQYVDYINNSPKIWGEN